MLQVWRTSYVEDLQLLNKCIVFCFCSVCMSIVQVCSAKTLQVAGVGGGRARHYCCSITVLGIVQKCISLLYYGKNVLCTGGYISSLASIFSFNMVTCSNIRHLFKAASTINGLSVMFRVLL